MGGGELDVFDDVGLGEADFGAFGALAGGGSVAEAAGDGGEVALGGEAQDFIKLVGIHAFHGAGVDAEEGGGFHEEAEGDVDLAG